MRSAALILLMGVCAMGFAQDTPRLPFPGDVAAIYFPGYHRDPHYDAWFGEKWNEWELLQNAPSRFPEHEVIQSEWGAFDEADPKMMEKQIALAADHDINVFIFDWYWYSGVKILHHPLEEGFLHAENRDRVNFALMWANHDWRNYFPAPYETTPTLLLPIRHSREDFEHVMDYCTQKYFREKNYWRVNGALFYSFFQPELFVERLGGPDAARAALDGAREKVKQAGLGSLHFCAFIWQPERIPMLKAAGFDSLTSYNITGSGKAHLPDAPLDKYEDVAARHAELWKQLDTGVLPYSPVVTAGWDPSPRWEKGTPWPPKKEDYPYGPLVVGSTPERFGQLAGEAMDHATTASVTPPAIMVNAWNEWTEGSALLPQKKRGTAYLDALTSAVHAQRKP